MSEITERTLFFAGLVLLTAVLYWMQSILIPLSLAVLLAFSLSPIVRAVQRLGMRRTSAVILVVTATFILLGGLTMALSAQVGQLAENMPEYERNIRNKIASFRQGTQGSAVDKLLDTTKRVSDDISDGAKGSTDSNRFRVPGVDQPISVAVQTDSTGMFWQVYAVATPMVQLVISAGFVLLLVILMLLKREDLRNRMIRLAGYGRLALTTRALEEAGTRISKFLLMRITINGAFGVVIGLGLAVIGVPFAVLWGMVVAVIRTIPTLGTWLAAVPPILLSLIAFEGWGPLIAVAALFGLLELVTTNILEPLLYGHHIGVSAMALFLALGFWTWLWGPIGLILATPLTVCLAVLGKYIPQLTFLNVLLGDQPAMDYQARYYQRLLAHDQDESFEIVEEYLDNHPPKDACDQLLLPALSNARADYDRNDLSRDDYDFMLRMTQEILEELADRKPSVASHDDEAPHANRILAATVNDEADELAMQMLALLAPPNWNIEILGASLLSSEIVAAVERDRPDIVCIVAIAPGGIVKARSLCKRLRQRFSDLKIVVGRWGNAHNWDKEKDALQACGANRVGAAIMETHKDLGQMILLGGNAVPGQPLIYEAD